MKEQRLRPPKGPSLLSLIPVIVGGGALLWLAPASCSLDTQGNQFGGETSESSGSSSSGLSSSSSSSGISSSSSSSSGSSSGGGAGSSSSSSSSSSGGAGGAGGGSSSSSSGAGGAGGAGGGPLSYEWNVGDPIILQGEACIKSYTYSIPAWLVFESPTPGERTSQIGEDKLCRHYTTDLPRARNVGKGWGLNIETDRKNLILNSDGWPGAPAAGWVTGNMMAQSGQPDPALESNAILFSSPASAGGNYSNYGPPNGGVNSQAASTWAKGSVTSDPTGRYAHFRHWIMGPYVDVKSTSWARYSLVQDTTHKAEMAFETGDKPAGAGVIMAQTSFYAFGAQLEDSALYPSSYIPTTDAQVTRAAEALHTKAGMLAMLAPGGYFTITLKFAPNFAVSAKLNEQSAPEYNLVFFEGKNRLFLRRSDRTMVLRINNNDLSTDPIEFSREQELTVTITNGKTGEFSLSVMGATTGDASVSASSGAAVNIAAGEQTYILAKNSGAEECADLRYLKFAPPP